MGEDTSTPSSAVTHPRASHPPMTHPMLDNVSADRFLSHGPNAQSRFRALTGQVSNKTTESCKPGGENRPTAAARTP